MFGEWYIPPTRGRDSMGLLTPRDVPRAVAEPSEAEWSRPEGHPVSV